MADRERTILLARVSSVAQEREGYSLDGQVETLQADASRHQRTVAALIRETAGASRHSRRSERVRRGIHQAMDMVRAGDADSISIVYLDRGSRTPTDIEELIVLLQSGIVLHQVGLGRSVGGASLTPEDAYMLRLDAARAALEVDILSRRVREGVARRQAAGLPSGPVPPGLRHERVDGRNRVVLDEAQAAIMIQLLEEYADGRHSIDTLAARGAALGLIGHHRGRPPSRAAWANLLGNPLLAGRLRDGRRGDFPAVVSESLWSRVQATRDRQRTRPCGAGRRAFALGQLLRCGSCGRAIVGVIARGHGGSYPYYRCSGRGCPAASRHIPEAELLAQAEAALAPMSLDQDLARHLEQRALLMLREEDGARGRSSAELERRIRELDTRILQATEASVRGQVDAKATHELVRRWREEQAAMQTEQAALRRDLDQVGEELRDLVDLARGVAGVLRRTAAEDPRRARSLLLYYLEDGPTLEDGRLVARLRPWAASWAAAAETARRAALDLDLGGSEGAARATPRMRLLKPPEGSPGADLQASPGDPSIMWAIRDQGRTWPVALLAAPRPGLWAPPVLELIRAA